MVDAEPQEIITNDNLNARVDAQVYFKVKEEEASVNKIGVLCKQLQTSDCKPCPYNAQKHHWDTYSEIGKQRAGKDQLRTS